MTTDWLVDPARPSVPLLAPLAPSRKKPRVGDVFHLRPSTDFVLFGRVVRVDANASCQKFPNGAGGSEMARDAVPGPGKSLLVYLYSVRAASPDRIPSLSPNDLLGFPILTNAIGWTQGWFQTVATHPLVEADLLPLHCFRRPRLGHFPGDYCDEHGRDVSVPMKPIGWYGLTPFGLIANQVQMLLAGEDPAWWCQPGR